MNKKSFIFRYRKIIMLVLALLAIIICVSATYITEYNNNKVTREDVFTEEINKQYKSSEEFLANFEEFTIYQSKNKNPIFDIEEDGYKEFKVITTAKESSKIKKDSLKISLALGADWIKYVSKIFNKKVTIGQEATITINGIDKIFPTSGNLWFTTVDQPRLYVLAEWSELNTQYYTYLEFDYETYSVIPTTE